MTLSDYLGLFPGDSRGHPRFMDFAEAVLRQAMDLMALTDQLQSGFSLASAQGVQLDQLAEALGLSRNDTAAGAACTDEEFRRYIRMKLALWRWDGTNEGVPEAMAEIPGGEEADNRNGTVSVSYTGSLPATARDVFPLTAGVRISP